MVEWRRAPISILIRPTAAVGISIFIWITALVFAKEPVLPNCEGPVWSREVLADLGRAEGDIARFPDSNRAGVVFLSNGQLVVYEVDLDTGQLSSRASPEISSPFRLRLSMLDAASGKLASSKEQGTRVHESAVLATTGGVLVKTGDVLKLYSQDLTQSRDVPLHLDQNGRFRVSVSASGKTVMLNEVIQDSSKRFYSHLAMLDAATLKIKYSWNESPPLYHHYSISDEGIAAVNLAGHFISVAAFGTSRWTRVAEPAGLCASMNMPTLYTDQQFVYGCDKLIAVSTEGHVLMTDSLPDGQVSSDKTTVARDGRFVAVSINTIGIKNRFRPEPSLRVTATQIAVYDLSLKRRVLTLNVEPQPKNDYDFALSPDGSLVAILNDRNVSVYSVPVPSGERATTVDSNDGTLRLQIPVLPCPKPKL
jgi:hypothetical protein